MSSRRARSQHVADDPTIKKQWLTCESQLLRQNIISFFLLLCVCVLLCRGGGGGVSSWLRGSNRSLTMMLRRCLRIFLALHSHNTHNVNVKQSWKRSTLYFLTQNRRRAHTPFDKMCANAICEFRAFGGRSTLHQKHSEESWFERKHWNPLY